MHFLILAAAKPIDQTDEHDSHNILLENTRKIEAILFTRTFATPKTQHDTVQ